jgi:hypothetical protein
MLPGEVHARRQVRAGHAALLRDSNTFQTFAIGLLSGGTFNLQGTRGVDDAVCLVALGLFIKACKQHRSVQLLARAGLGEDALALTRCLFETTLALVLTLKDRVRMRSNGVLMPTVPSRHAGSMLRARLYLANIAFEHDRTLREFGRTRGLRRFRRRAGALREVARQVGPAEYAIGPQWSQRLRRSRSYSGGSVKDLALTLRFLPTYATLYRYASWSVHAIDLAHFVTQPAQAGARLRVQIAPSDAEVPGAVNVANALLLACVRSLNRRFRLGHNQTINGHARQLNL